MSASQVNVSEVLIVGGVIAGAYILYKLSNIGGSAASAVSGAVKSVADAAKNTVASVSAGISDIGKIDQTAVPVKPTDSIANLGTTDPASFTGVLNMNVFDPLDPMYTAGQVYTQNNVPAIVQNRVSSPFVLN